MLKHFVLLSFFTLTGLVSLPQSAQGQALVPYVLKLDEERLEQQGFFLFHSAVDAFQRGDYDLEQASTQIQLAAQIAPNNPQILATLGELYNRQQNHDQALIVLRQAQAIDPENPAILFELGTVHLHQGEYAQAAALLEQGLEISPNVFGALFDLGNAYYQLKEYDDAIANYEQAVAVQDDLWFAINNIGLVLYEQNDVKGAMEYWQQAIDMTERQETEPLLAMAVARFHQGEREAALDQGTRALILDWDYADLEFLRENLWGDRLLSDTAEFLGQPQIQSVLPQEELEHSQEHSHE